MTFLFLKLFYSSPMIKLVSSNMDEEIKLIQDLFKMKEVLDIPTLNLDSLVDKVYKKKK